LASGFEAAGVVGGVVSFGVVALAVGEVGGSTLGTVGGGDEPQAMATSAADERMNGLFMRGRLSDRTPRSTREMLALTASRR
jgi:hypothetical protein